MSHHIYQTEGLVLGGFNVGESNRFLYIFTKDLGFVGASAQGVRELKSKLRYSLQDFSYTKIDLVRGKQVWRITNAEKINALNSVVENKDKQKIFARITSLIKRLFTGEGDHSELWEEIISGFIFLEKEHFTEENLRCLEVLLVIKLLDHLGYWGDHDEFLSFLKKNRWEKKLLEDFAPLRQKALREVNASLIASHL